MVTSPMDETTHNRGRPYGGTAILYHSNINAKIERIHTDCKRLTIAAVTINTFKFCIFSVYMPYDEQRVGPNLVEFIDVLNEIHSVCLNSECQYFVIGGDLNCDIFRNNPQTQALNTFIEEENLRLCLNHGKANVPYTFNSGDIFSTLDHFIVTPNLEHSVVKYESDFLANNFSDHIPIVLQVNVDIDYHKMHNITARPNVAWHRCNDENLAQYEYEIDRLISETSLDFDVFACSDLDCKLHKDKLCEWYSEVVRILLTASQSSLPMTSSRDKPKVIPGWNDIVKPKLENSLYWHRVWVDRGRPRSGDIAYKMRRARGQYHYAVRYVHKEYNNLRNIRMAEAISNNNQRDLYKEAKVLYGVRKKLPDIIDDKKRG